MNAPESYNLQNECADGFHDYYTRDSWDGLCRCRCGCVHPDDLEAALMNASLNRTSARGLLDSAERQPVRPASDAGQAGDAGAEGAVTPPTWCPSWQRPSQASPADFSCRVAACADAVRGLVLFVWAMVTR